jgi:hypothetical protein
LLARDRLTLRLRLLECFADAMVTFLRFGRLLD